MNPVLITAIGGIVTSALAILGTFLSPIITAWYEAKHEKQMYEERFIVERRIKAVETYLENLGRYLFHERSADKCLSEGISSIFIYAPEELWGKIENMNRTIIALEADRSDYYDNRLKAAQAEYMEICKAFSVFSSALPDSSHKNRKNKYKTAAVRSAEKKQRADK